MLHVIHVIDVLLALIQFFSVPSLVQVTVLAVSNTIHSLQGER